MIFMFVQHTAWHEPSVTDPCCDNAARPVQMRHPLCSWHVWQNEGKVKTACLNSLTLYP